MSPAIEERKIQDAWKVVDQAVRLIARARDVLAPLHCDIRLAGIQRSLESRCSSPYFVLGFESAPDHRVWSASREVVATRALRPLRQGVFVLPVSGEKSSEAKGQIRVLSDVADCTPETAAWLCNADHRVIAPRLEGKLLESIFDLPVLADRAFAAYGALREAFHAVKELDQIARAELEAIDRALTLADRDGVPAEAGPLIGDLDYLQRLDALLSDQIQRERELARDREQLARNYKLQSIGLTDPLAAVDLSDREDERRKSSRNLVFGKAVVFVTLRDEAINRLVDDVEKVALESVRKRVGRIGHAIEKLGKGRLQRVLGLRIATAEDVETATEEGRRRRMQEAIGVAGREFQFKIERLGAMNRLMRARMEVAGLLMVVSLTVAAFGTMTSAQRGVLLKVTLSVAAVITVYSYLSARSIEQEKRDDELIRLRGLLRKPVAEAIGRAYVDAMSVMTQQLEAVRAEIKRRIELGQSKKQSRAAPEPPASLVKVEALRAQIARTLGGMGGISAIEAQVAAQLLPGAPLRAALEPYLAAMEK